MEPRATEGSTARALHQRRERDARHRRQHGRLRRLGGDERLPSSGPLAPENVRDAPRDDAVRVRFPGRERSERGVGSRSRSRSRSRSPSWFASVFASVLQDLRRLRLDGGEIVQEKIREWSNVAGFLRVEPIRRLHRSANHQAQSPARRGDVRGRQRRRRRRGSNRTPLHVERTSGSIADRVRVGEVRVHGARDVRGAVRREKRGEPRARE